MHAPAPTRRLGIAAAAASLVFSLAYVVAQVFEWTGLLGSAGGPNAASTAWGLALLLPPSLLLGPSFVILLAALHQCVPAKRKAFTLAGLSLGAMYATLTGMVYFVQLTFVGPRLAAGEVAGIELLLFVPYRSFLFAVDLLGYTMMCAAAALAGLGLPRGTATRPARLALIAHAALIPFLALQMFVPELIWGGAAWGVLFPLAMALLLRLFRTLPAQG